MSDEEEIKSIREVVVGTVLLGRSIDTRALRERDFVAKGPLTFKGEGQEVWMVFRYGVVVFFNVSSERREEVIKNLLTLVREPFADRRVLEEVVCIEEGSPDSVKSGRLYLKSEGIKRLQVVSIAFARSAVLDFYEQGITKRLELLMPIADQLKAGVVKFGAYRQLMRLFGEGLHNQYAMAGHVEVVDSPDLVWNSKELQGLFQLLETDYELKERADNLERKMQLITQTAESVYHLGGLNRTIRVEWYIVILIVVEIVIMIFEKL